MSAEDDRVLSLLAETLAVPDREPPADRVAALRALVEADGARRAQAAPTPLAAPGAGRRGGRWRLPLVAVAAAAALALVFGLGWAVARPVARSEGQLEFAGSAATEGATTSQLDIRRRDGERVVRLRSDDLGALPQGEFYEMWFVRPGPTPGDLAVVSAGTFQPGAAGRTDVRFPAGIDPAEFPLVLVTAEPPDGDPAPGGAEVLRFDLLDPAHGTEGA
jgi:anti-sigma-K factor RskA